MQPEKTGNGLKKEVSESRQFHWAEKAHENRKPTIKRQNEKRKQKRGIILKGNLVRGKTDTI